MTNRVRPMPAACGDVPQELTWFLQQAVAILRAETRPREALERLLAQTFGLRAPAIHLAGEPLDVGPGRVLVPGGSETLRLTAAGALERVAAAAPAAEIAGC